MPYGKKKVRNLIMMAPLLSLGLLCSFSAQAQMVLENDTTEAATSKTLMAAQQAYGTTRSVDAAFDRLAFLNALSPMGQTGFSSGNTPLGINLWVNPYYSHSRDQNASTGYNSNTYGAFFGGDYALNSQLTAGLMLGVDNTDVDSKVNEGGSDTDGFTVAPYARYTLNKNYSADATFGYTTSNSDNDRLVLGTRVTGSGETERWFGAVGVNASFWQDRWNYQARLGTSVSRDHRDSFTESDSTFVDKASSSFGQMQIGGTVGYYFEKVRPWFSATYSYDYNRTLPVVAVDQALPSDDRDQLVLGLGTTVFGFGNVTGDLSLKQTVLKEDYDNTTLGLTLSTTF